MKPYKMVGLANLTLILFTIISYGTLKLESDNLILSLIFNTMFSFIFPAFIFFNFWLVAYNRKEKHISLPKFYFKVFLNVVFPYFICMIPYIIYKYWVNNLEFNKFTEILVTGNIAEAFAFVRTLIHLLIIYPFVEYLAKLNKNITIIVSFALSIIFNMFSLNNYIHTEVFNYLIFMTLGIFFAQNLKEPILLLRKKNKQFMFYLVLVIALNYLTTRFKIYSFFNPAVITLYNLLVTYFTCYFCYRHKEFHYQKKKTINNLIVNNTIVVVSGFLMIEIIFNIAKELFKCVRMIKSEIMVYFVLVGCIILMICVDKINNKTIKRRKKINQKG